MEKRYLNFNDLDCYKIAFELSNYVWNIAISWDYFARDTVGKQYVKSIDSISANIAEGFGRYTKKDKICFYRYSYGSIKESIDWTEKAKIRQLITINQYKYIIEELNKLPKLVNQLIQFTDIKLSK